MGKQEKKQTILTPKTEFAMAFEEPSERKQVGILGGCFNPVHHAHLIVADQVYNQLGLDSIYLMPTAESPHVDEKPHSDVSHRLAMLELAVASDEHMKIEEIEIKRGGKSYTFDTMKALKEQHPDTDYYFIIGGDMVAYLPTWHRVNELLELVQLVGVRRPNYSVTSSYPIIWVDVPFMDISSSMIRKKVQNNCSINYLLPKNVIDYIYKKGLYRHGVE